MNPEVIRKIGPRLGMRVPLTEQEAQLALASAAAKKAGIEPPFISTEVTFNPKTRETIVTIFEG